MEGPIRLKRNRNFQPCPTVNGDELYPNGIFVFNIIRFLAYIEAHLDAFPVGSIVLADIPDYGANEHLDEETIRAADLSRPLLLAEIAPGRYNVIDGHHRIARARREAVTTLPVWRVRCPEHIPFLTTVQAYESYVTYWNSKVKNWSLPPEGRP
jgi:hypothetical protein